MLKANDTILNTTIWHLPLRKIVSYSKTYSWLLCSRRKFKVGPYLKEALHLNQALVYYCFLINSYFPRFQAFSLCMTRDNSYSIMDYFGYSFFLCSSSILLLHVFFKCLLPLSFYLHIFLNYKLIFYCICSNQVCSNQVWNQTKNIDNVFLSSFKLLNCGMYCQKCSS